MIDSVIIPTTMQSNMVDTAVAAGSFTTLVAALQPTGLDVTLADDSTTYTEFTPTDSSFELLGEETINSLMNQLMNKA